MKSNIALKRRSLKNVLDTLDVIKEVNMSNKFSLILVTLLLLTVTACSGMRALSKQEIDCTISAVEQDRSRAALEEGRQAMELALEFHDQGGFEKAAELFLEAADKFRMLNARDEERKALVSAAKMQLKCSERKAFLLTMARLKGFLARFEMPTEEERFLVNLSDRMKNQPLSYPVKGSWRVVFQGK